MLRTVPLFVLLTLVACGGDDDEEDPGEDCQATDEIFIENEQFVPSCIRVEAGTLVTWTHNDGIEEHTVTSDNDANEAFDSQGEGDGVLVEPETFAFTFTTPGENPGHCEIHLEMSFNVVVE
jgi:plastocyanin